MKRLILIPLMMIALSAVSQRECDSIAFKREIIDAKHMKSDAFVKFGVGGFAHAVGFQELIGGPLSDPNVRSGFILYNSIGLSFDVLTVIQLVRAKRKEKKYKNLL